jgi:cyclic pyranopterin phosphate synthase
MRDIYSRQIDYLRIAVTDRCNLRCTYCMPAEGLSLKSHSEILSMEEIFQIVQAVVPLGINKIRLTGGEPLVRLGLLSLIEQIRSLPEITDISLTTNGVLLKDFAASLKKAGLNRVNISLDTLNVGKFQQITRLGNIVRVHEGIDAALAAELEPVKLNVVIIKGVNDNEILDFVELTRNRPLHVRFIELMPIGESDAKALATYIPVKQIKQLVETKYELEPVKRLKGCGPTNSSKTSLFTPAKSRPKSLSTPACRSTIVNSWEVSSNSFSSPNRCLVVAPK